MQSTRLLLSAGLLLADQAQQHYSTSCDVCVPVWGQMGAVLSCWCTVGGTKCAACCVLGLLESSWSACCAG